MISDAGSDERVRKIRVGRFVLYAVGFGIGIIGVLFLYISVFMYSIVLGISSLSSFYADRVILFGIVGTVFFILSLWGIAKEERYGTGSQMKGSAFFYANIIFMILLFGIVIIGLFSILDLLFWHKLPHTWPDYNYIAGVLYLPVGIILFILSILKLRRDYRYRKQYY